jgi:hypothetical protein
MTSTDALIHDLSTDLAPVQRRQPWREAGTLLALGAAEAVLLVAAGAMRPDMGRVILEPFMAWKVGSLALLAAVSCTVAVRSFAPPAASRRDLALTLALAILAMGGGALVTTAAENGRPLIERLAPVHGVCCAVAIVILALPMVSVLGWMMRRAAPVQPERSALATGLAAAICGALVFTICCPANDPLYVVVWYSAGVAAVTVAARGLLPRRFRL